MIGLIFKIGEFLFMGMPIITPGTASRCQAITDIISSVALEQAALAHILNAEGEKIQKIVADTTLDTAVIIETNKSVRSMVDATSRLEMILQSKLQLFENCICETCSTTTTTTSTTTTTTTTS